MSPERLAAYAILAPFAIWLVVIASVAALRAGCWLWDLFAGVAAEAFPPEPEAREQSNPDQQKQALRSLCSHIRKPQQ